MEPEEESHCTLHWQRTVLKTLKSLPSTIPDCCIIVGTERILTHKTVLQLNSALLTAGDVGYNKQSDIIEIDLLQEFSEHFNLVSDIVNSFYTGILEVEEENLKIVYKFAKCYSVQWIMDYLRPMFVEYVKKDEGCERFIVILKFAESIWCTDLADACCELLDSELMNNITHPSVISTLDLFVIKSITLSEKLGVPEQDIFKFVTDWLSTNLGSQNTDCVAILENIQFQLIEIDYLSDEVFDFILDQPQIPEALRKALLKKVRDLIKEPSQFQLENCRSRSLRFGIEKYSSENDETLKKIALRQCGKDKDATGQNIEISNEELRSIIFDKFKFMSAKDQGIFIDYLLAFRSVTTEFYDQLLILHNTFPSAKLLWCVTKCAYFDHPFDDVPKDIYFMIYLGILYHSKQYVLSSQILALLLIYWNLIAELIIRQKRIIPIIPRREYGLNI